MHDLVIRGGTIVDGTGGSPITGDVAVDGQRVTEVGKIDESARHTIDADGLVVAPGWIDTHTHYDGQLMWDPEITPSSWHGVTTAVIGNCSVGFAPVRPGSEDFLMEVMEGVEDIPVETLRAGIDWRWSSYPDYLDVLDATPLVLDIAPQVPHAVVRAFVMGERAHEATPTDDDLGEMTRIIREALEAGAIGVSTSRTVAHRSRYGPLPGTFAGRKELLALAAAMAPVGRRVFEVVSEGKYTPEEQALLTEVARAGGATLSLLHSETVANPGRYREILAWAERLLTEGVHLAPQVGTRGNAVLFGLESATSPFATHPTYLAMRHLPLHERVARLRDPAVRSALVTEAPTADNRFDDNQPQFSLGVFRLGDPPEYEPDPAHSAAAVARRSGCSTEEVMLDWMLENDGRALLYSPLCNYRDGCMDAALEMMIHPLTVLGLGDAGAHCTAFSDAGMPSFLLTHWVRDRTRGPRIALETAVAMQTSRVAAAYGFRDRGTLEPGKKADLNLIDLPALRLRPPEMVSDFPAGGRRLVQHVDGYRATIVSGEVTFEDGKATGARPGRPLRLKP